MRAKLVVNNVVLSDYSDTLELQAVYGGDKNSEDNTFSKATPSASMKIQIDNPELRGQFKPGQKFYVDFTPAA
jgi:hypothetical protein